MTFSARSFADTASPDHLVGTRVHRRCETHTASPRPSAALAYDDYRIKVTLSVNHQVTMTNRLCRQPTAVDGPLSDRRATLRMYRVHRESFPGICRRPPRLVFSRRTCAVYVRTGLAMASQIPVPSSSSPSSPPRASPPGSPGSLIRRRWPPLAARDRTRGASPRGRCRPG